jgi:hypothetical protein
MRMNDFMQTLLVVSQILVDTTMHAGYSMSKAVTKQCADVFLDLYVYCMVWGT